MCAAEWHGWFRLLCPVRRVRLILLLEDERVGDDDRSPIGHVGETVGVLTPAAPNQGRAAPGRCVPPRAAPALHSPVARPFGHPSAAVPFLSAPAPHLPQVPHPPVHPFIAEAPFARRYVLVSLFTQCETGPAVLSG